MSLIFGESFRTLRICSRKFAITCTQRGTDKLDFQGRVLNKLLSNKLERKIRDSGSKPAIKILDNKRIGALNKMYMVNISEVLALGDFPDIMDKGIEITRVSVRDTSTVEVFWLADENQDQIEVQNLLTSVAGKVANKLMYANMLGHVPTIKFIRDLSAVNFEETKKLLDKIALQNSLREKNQENSEDSNPIDEDIEDIEPPPPVMTTNVLGLPHDRIYRRILEAKKRCYPLQIPKPPTTQEFENSHQQSQSENKAVEEKFKQKKALKKFIVQYQKSALRSGARVQHQRIELLNREEIIYEYPEDDDSSDSRFQQNWKDEDRP